MSEGEPAKTGAVLQCVHAERCGGCPLIALAYDEQLARKHGRVITAIARYGALGRVAAEPVLPADPIRAYRTRAKLIVGRKGEVGLFARGGGHEVVDIPECLVLSPSLSRVANLIRTRISADEAISGALAPHSAKSSGLLRAVDLREIRGGETHRDGVLVTLVMQRAPSVDMALLRGAAAALMSESSEIMGVALNLHAGESPQVLGAETIVLAGAASAFDRVGESTHLATYGSFVQAHRGQASRVHELIAGALGLRGGITGRPLDVLDLYGGSGAISLALAARGANVHLVEAFAPAVAQARHAAAEQRLTLAATCGDVERALHGFVSRGARFDAVIVNPPRRGTSPAVRELVARLGAECIIYVSCDPETLARDLDHLSRGGYLAASIRPLDMIPLTDEVESVACMRKGTAPRPLVVYEDDDVIFVDKAAHEPIESHAYYTGSLLGRVRALPGAERSIPLTHLDPGASGVVAFARSPEHAALWRAALASPEARMIHLAAARGIMPTKGNIARALPGEALARTRYRRIAIVGGHSVVRAVPEQPREHQILRHFSAIGHAIIGDDRHGHAPTNRFFEERHGLDRTFLHCSRIEIAHPVTARRLAIEAPIAGDLRMVLERANGSAALRWLDDKARSEDHRSSATRDPSSRPARGGRAEIDSAATSTPPGDADRDGERV